MTLPFNVDVVLLAAFRHMVGSRHPDAIEFAAALGQPGPWEMMTRPMVAQIITELEEMFRQNDALERVQNPHTLFAPGTFALWRDALGAAMLDLRRRDA